jgi:hypothetical protein
MHPSKVVTADGRYLVVDPEETRKFPSRRPYYHPSRNPGPFVPVSRIESSATLLDHRDYERNVCLARYERVPMVFQYDYKWDQHGLSRTGVGLFSPRNDQMWRD